MLLFLKSVKLANVLLYFDGYYVLASVALNNVIALSSEGSFVPRSPRKALARMDFFIISIFSIIFLEKINNVFWLDTVFWQF